MNLDEVITGLRMAGAEFEDVEAKRAAGGVPESLDRRAGRGGDAERRREHRPGEADSPADDERRDRAVG